MAQRPAVSAFTTEIVALAALTPHPQNYQIHTPANRAHIRASLLAHGYYKNIVVAEDNTLLAGHGVVDVATELGWTDVPVHRLPYPPDHPEALKVLIGDNDAARLNTRDDAQLAELLAGLQAQQVSLDGTGWDAAGLEALLAEQGQGGEDQAGRDVEPQVDRAEELREEWQVEAGQLWACGEHRLIVGDCTDKAVVERLMQGRQLRVLVTSPPYLNQRAYTQFITDWQHLAVTFMEVALLYCQETTDILVNLGLVHRDGQVERYWEPWLDGCANLGASLYGWYVWDKLAGFPGEWNGRLAPCHEWIFHFSLGHQSANKWVEKSQESLRRGIKGITFRQSDGTTRPLSSPHAVGQPYKIPDSVIRLSPENARGLTDAHPARFPVTFAEFLCQTWSNVDDIVYDPFLGSGTTLIACENLQRTCYGCEIDPGYVAVTLQRYVDVTGDTPQRLEP